MTANNTESLGTNSSSGTRSVFYCPEWPELFWDLSHTIPLKVILAVVSIASPVTILLNLLVIIAVKTRRELKKNSNILLSSLAAGDLLVGAVSMPLSITLDALVLQPILFEDTICTIYSTSDIVLNALGFVSFFHLVLIAWDRYVAIVKCMEYKAIVTKGRVKKCATVAWLLPLLMFVPMTIMLTVGVPYELILVAIVVLCIFWGGCFLLIIYCYVKIYLQVRKQNRTQIRSVNALVQAKVERKIAYTAFWITLFQCISGMPIVVLYTFWTIWPFLQESSSFRSAETMLQLNSLVNPLLYFYRNRQLRKTALELLRCRKPQIMQPVTRTAGRIGRRRYSVASLDVQELQSIPKRPSFVRSQSCDNLMGSNETVNERPITTSKIANDKVFTQQRNKRVVTVQIENAQRMKRIQRNNESPKDTLENSRHHMVGKIARSTSLNENSFVTLTNCHQNAAERNFKRSRSLPILSTNLNTLENKQTIAELASEKEPTWNSYEETKL